MAEFLLTGTVALLAALLTLFSGFGLGTLLMPALALLFPVPVAVAITAVVHLLNNLFKLLLVGRHADRRVVLRFGLLAALGALLGARLLVALAGMPVLGSYQLFGHVHEVSSVKLVAGLLISIFALFEASPRHAALQLPARYLPAGGLLSGFFGGLTGNQGALRAAFLVRLGLDKNAFIGTSVVCAVIVDTVRITVYGLALGSLSAESLRADTAALLLVAVLAAFAGSFIGVRLLGKVTLRFIQLSVAAMMLVVGLGLASGLL